MIKAYVAAGLGIGIVSNLSLGEGPDERFVAADISHLFPTTHTVLSLRRDIFLREHLVEFIGRVNPTCNRSAIRAALER